jgi:hypothetical protein
VAYFKVLSRHFPKETEENHEGHRYPGCVSHDLRYCGVSHRVLEIVGCGCGSGLQCDSCS